MARALKGSTSLRHSVITPTTSSSISMGLPERSAETADSLDVGPPVAGVGEHVLGLLRAAIECHPARRGSASTAITG